MLDCPLAQVVEHLVAGDSAGAGDAQRLVEIGDIEIADAPGQDLALGLELFEGGERLRQRV